MLISLAARPRSWFCGLSFAGNGGSNPAGGMGMSLVSVVCCEVEVTNVTGKLLAQRESYRVLCVSLSVIGYNNNFLHQQ
jgi:hypothetical protein